MPFFAVTYTHRDDTGWQTDVIPHMEYLQNLVMRRARRVGRPLAGASHRSRLLIIQAPSREAALEEIENDPFKVEGLIDDLSATAWFPNFGIFTDAPNAIN
jgi:uncharacterized protein YciI